MKQSYTILYVDDDTDDLLLISDVFERYADHPEVVHAGSGMEGLQVLENMAQKNTAPGLLLIDINMPGMNGKQMLEKLRVHHQYDHLPVILFSTSGSPTDKQFAENHGAEFISKPGSYSELKTLVEQFLTRCRFEVQKTA